MLIEQLSIFLENKQGRLSTLTSLLQENQLDIRALSIADSQDYGIVRMIVNDIDRACRVLQDANFMFKCSPVVAFSVQDTPGGLASVIALLDHNAIEVEYMYAFVSRIAGTAYVVLRANDNEKTEAVFEKAGIPMVSQSDISTDL